MSEVTQQNQIENSPEEILEEQMFDYADNFDIKKLGKEFINFIDDDTLDTRVRYENKGKQLDDSYIDDFHLAQRLSNRLKYHLKNDYGFNSEVDFRSFKIVSGLRNKIFHITADGEEYPCFGTRRDKESLDSDIVTIKYSQAGNKEPKYVFNGEEYDCQEVFEILKEKKGRLSQRLALRKYYVEGKQMISCQLLAEEEKKSENYSKI